MVETVQTTEAPAGDKNLSIDEYLQSDEGDESSQSSTTSDNSSGTSGGSQQEAKTTQREGAEGDQSKSEGKEEGKAGEGEEEGGKKEGEGEEEPKVLSDEAFQREARKALGLKDTEPETRERLKARIVGIERETTKMVQERKQLNEFLAGKGLNLVYGNDGAGLVPDSKFIAQKSDDIAPGIFKSLTKDEAELHLEKPEEFAKVIAAKAIEAVSSRLVPTKEASSVRISDSIKPMLTLEVAGAKNAEGEEVHPDYNALEPYINAFIDDGMVPASFKDWMNQSEENYKFGKSLAYAKVHQRVARMLAEHLDAKAQLDEKKKAAKGDASLTDQGTRASKTKKSATQSDTEKAEADEIVNAKDNF